MIHRKIITGIYGGSFNPIHRGHVCLAKALAETEFVDEIWLLVSPQNPFKVDDCLLDDALRLRLTRMAVAHEPKVEVCDREFTLPRPSYMYNTLTALSQEHPDREFVLVIGADNWERFHRWYRSDDILSAYRLIVDTPLLDISSTEIRRRIASEPDYNGEGLPPVVWEEIKGKNLYR